MNTGLSRIDGNTRYCIAVPLDLLIKSSPATVVGKVRDKSGRALEFHEIVFSASVLKAKGFVVVPACDHTDKQGYCLGHPLADAGT